MIEIVSLSSGSNGNAILVRLGARRLLVDAGLPYRRLAKLLRGIGEDPGELDAVLVSHEHLDHARGVPLLQRRHPNVHVMATSGTLRALRRCTPYPVRSLLVDRDRPMHWGDVRILPFGLSHDAEEPVGFRLEYQASAIGIATDLGRGGRTVREGLSGCRLVILEANHDPHLLECGSYPEFFKRRVASTRGHLSNQQARDLVGAVAGPQLEHVVLAHLSEDNNTPQTALNAVAPALRAWPRVRLSVAERICCSPPIRLAAAPAWAARCDPRGQMALELS